MLKFGDVIRVDPRIMPQVRQPDSRRWMVVVVARTDAALPWKLLFLDGEGFGWATTSFSGQLSTWPNLYGFCKPEEVE
jgi:hypothetical protein